MDQKRFEEAKRKIIGVDRQRLGIGTLSEKTVHAIFKDYYEPDEDHQEIPIENYVADIYKDGEIIEIQTRQFNRMRGKLQAFLPMYPVTIVYPIPYEKWLIWIDEDSGELSKKRKSPKKGSTYQAFKELYKIKMFLKDPNIRFKFVLVNRRSAATILEGCGGKDNIASIDNCITRLRLEVKDITAVNDKVIKSAGVAGVMKPGKTSVQVIIGPKVQFVADAFSKLCE